MTKWTLAEECRDAAGHSRRLRHDLVVRLLGTAQERPPALHAEVLGAAWNEAARSRRPPPRAVPRDS